MVPLMEVPVRSRLLKALEGPPQFLLVSSTGGTEGGGGEAADGDRGDGGMGVDGFGHGSATGGAGAPGDATPAVDGTNGASGFVMLSFS